MNIELLQQVRDAILKNPEHFDIEHWFMDQGSVGTDTKLIQLNGNTCERMITPGENNCGTTACIAGWALNIAGTKLEEMERFYYEYGMERTLKPGQNVKDVVIRYSIELTAMRVLELTRMESRDLFFKDNWPSYYFNAYLDYPSYLPNYKTERAQVTADRINHFIKTGK